MRVLCGGRLVKGSIARRSSKAALIWITSPFSNVGNLACLPSILALSRNYGGRSLTCSVPLLTRFHRLVQIVHASAQPPSSIRVSANSSQPYNRANKHMKKMSLRAEDWWITVDIYHGLAR